jgi:hypothetical protein
MFQLFRSRPYTDPDLGDLVRRRGMWRGRIDLPSAADVPLALIGSRTAPRPEALKIAAQLKQSIADLRPAIARALYEHYSPYAEAVAAGEEPVPMSALPAIEAPADVWRHVSMVFVSVAPLDGHLTAEIGFSTAWDEEHTLGVRFRDGQLIDLCGSVLPP